MYSFGNLSLIWSRKTSLSRFSYYEPRIIFHKWPARKELVALY